MAIKPFHSFQTIKKYTKALLDTFNGIQVERVRESGKKEYIIVPITFASKDPVFTLSEAEVEQVLSGNTNFLPRMSLSLETMEPLVTSRGLNRATYLELPNGEKKSFLYNSFGVELVYQIIIETRSLTELTEIVEQILPYFCPTLNLRVRELDNLSEPTSIKVEFMMAEMNLPTDHNEHNARICSGALRIKLHGNIYPAIQDQEIIKYIKLYMAVGNEENKVARADGKPGDPIKFKPIREASLVLDNVEVKEQKESDTLKLIPVYDDPDNELFSVIYNIVYKENETDNISNVNNFGVLAVTSRCIVSVQLIDKNKRVSNYVEVSVKRDLTGEYNITVFNKE